MFSFLFNFLFYTLLIFWLPVVTFSDVEHFQEQIAISKKSWPNKMNEWKCIQISRINFLKNTNKKKSFIGIKIWICFCSLKLALDKEGDFRMY